MWHVTWTILYLIFGREWWPHKATQSKIPDDEKYKKPFFLQTYQNNVLRKYTPPTPSVIFCYMSFSAKKTLYIRKGGGAKLGVQRILLSLECFASLSQIDGESSMDGDWGQYGRLNIEAQSNFPLNGPLHIVHKDICILLLCKSHLSQICNTWVLREWCKKNTWELGIGLVTR